MEVKTNVVFHHLEESTNRYTIEQGGTRSGKTYNILLWLISQGLRSTGKTITISRKTLPSLRTSSMRDFFEILERMNLYREGNHNKTESTYRLNGNLYEFISLDQPQKVRGRKRNILFINEANELTKEDFFQLNIRTTDKVIIDYNPSEEFWVLDEVKPRTDADFHITTYKDNPFLPDSLVREIERLQEQDEWYWKVYGLGQMAAIQGVIFTNYEIQQFDPEEKELMGYGLDFGFSNHPTAMVEVRMAEGELWLRQLIYERGLTNPDIARQIEELKIETEIIADLAEPKSIEEIARAGVLIRGANKGPDSVRAGIDKVRQWKLNIHPDSVDLIREVKSYKYKQDKDGNYINEPVKKYDHLMDALRYFIFTALDDGGYGEYEFI